MRLTAFTDYGLRALMRLAAEPSRVFTTEEIAQEFKISRHHLFKVVRDLADAGFVTTQRGAHGGFSLARSPDQIRIGDVVELLEARHAIVECFREDGGTCPLASRCKLSGPLVRAHAAFIAEPNKTNLKDCMYAPV